MKILGCLIVGGVMAGLVAALLLRAPKTVPLKSEAPSTSVSSGTPAPVVNTPEPEVVARIGTAPGAIVVVKHLKLSFTFVLPPGEIVSFYNPSDYPTLDAIPLSSGQRASFTSLAKVIFSNLSKRERTFVEEKDRTNYGKGAIDEEGYHTFSVQLIQAAFTTPNGETVVDTIECPEHSGVALTGDTALGSYKMSLWGLRKPLVVNLERSPASAAP